MALPATDNFNRAAIGTNWTNSEGTLTIEASTVARTGTASVDTAAFWNADTFGNDHYSQCKVVVCNTDTQRMVGVTCRHQSGANSWYGGGVLGPLGAGAPVQIRRCLAGVKTTLTSGTATVVANDVLKLEVSGSSPATIVLKVNGVQVLSTTDSSAGLSSGGAAGVFVFSDVVPNTDAELDDWTGDNISGGGAETITMDKWFPQAAPLRRQTAKAVPSGVIGIRNT